MASYSQLPTVAMCDCGNSCPHAKFIIRHADKKQTILIVTSPFVSKSTGLKMLAELNELKIIPDESLTRLRWDLRFLDLPQESSEEAICAKKNIFRKPPNLVVPD